MTDITKKDITRWAENQNASFVGRGFEINKPDDRKAFVDWFYRVLNEIVQSKEPME